MRIKPQQLLSVRYPLLGIITAICLILYSLTVSAQVNPQVPVVVDGQPLFKVSRADPLSAEERADLLNLRLQQLVQSASPIQVKIETRNQSPTIVVNDRHLLTVTQSDTTENRTPTEQANLWAKQLRQTLEQAQKERSAGFFKNLLLLSLGAVALAIALFLGMGWLWRYARQIILQRFIQLPTDDETVAETPKALNLLFNLTLFGARTGVLVAAALYITNLFPISRSWSYTLTHSLVSSFTSPVLSIGKNHYAVADLLLLASILLGWTVLSGAAANFFKLRILHATRISRGDQEVIAVIAKYALIVFGTIVLLQVWGIDLSSLTIVVSALGVGIGFGFQNIAKNFGSGMILLFERPIQVGDFVTLGDLEGTVVRISARSTVLRTLDHISIIVPNARFLEEEVINWSYENPVSRVRIPVGVAYGSDIGAVKQTLLQAPQGNHSVLAHPEPKIFFLGFGESSLDFELRVWIKDPSAQYRIKSDLFFRIEELFRSHEIEIPFPQRDLHVRSSSIPLALSPQLESTLRDAERPSQPRPTSAHS